MEHAGGNEFATESKKTLGPDQGEEPQTLPDSPGAAVVVVAGRRYGWVGCHVSCVLSKKTSIQDSIYMNLDIMSILLVYLQPRKAGIRLSAGSRGTLCP